MNEDMEAQFVAAVSSTRDVDPASEPLVKLVLDQAVRMRAFEMVLNFASVTTPEQAVASAATLANFVLTGEVPAARKEGGVVKLHS